jgi:hypothetical protein
MATVMSGVGYGMYTMAKASPSLGPTRNEVTRL